MTPATRTHELLRGDAFCSARDEIALASMRSRRVILWRDRRAIAVEINELLDALKPYPAPPSGIQYGLTREQFNERMRIINIRENLLRDLDEKTRVWAALDAVYADIIRALPVVKARLAAYGVEQPSQITAFDSMMNYFGYKKASGE